MLVEPLLGMAASVAPGIASGGLGILGSILGAGAIGGGLGAGMGLFGSSTPAPPNQRLRTIMGWLNPALALGGAVENYFQGQDALEGNQELLSAIRAGYGSLANVGLQGYGDIGRDIGNLYYGEDYATRMPQLRKEAGEYESDLNALRSLRGKKFVVGKGGVADRYGVKTKADLERFISELETKVPGLRSMADEIERTGPGGLIGQFDKLNTEAQAKIKRDAEAQAAGYARRTASVLGDIQNVNKQALADAEKRTSAAIGRSLSDANARGLGGSSIAAGNVALAKREGGQEIRRINEDTARLRSGVRAGLLGDELVSSDAYNRLGLGTGLNLGGERIGLMGAGGNQIIGASERGLTTGLDALQNYLRFAGGTQIPYPQQGPFQTAMAGLGASGIGSQPVQQPSGGSILGNAVLGNIIGGATLPLTQAAYGLASAPFRGLGWIP